MSTPSPRIFVLNDPHSMRINAALAVEIGLNESILLLQLEFLIAQSRHERDGKLWTYQSLADLQRDYFPYWSITTISRVIKSLLDKSLIHVANYNKAGFDRTRWFAINHEGIAKLSSIAIFQNEKSIFQSGGMQPAKMENATRQNETTIPETTAETTPESRAATPPPIQQQPPQQPAATETACSVLAEFYGQSILTRISPANQQRFNALATNFAALQAAIKRWRTMATADGRPYSGANVDGILRFYDQEAAKPAYQPRPWELEQPPEPIKVATAEEREAFFRAKYGDPNAPFVWADGVKPKTKDMAA